MTETLFPQQRLFLLADAALREVIDQIDPESFTRETPPAWSFTPGPHILRDVLAAHARDEAWVPDVIAGLTVEEAGDRYNGDLLGDDPIASYDALNDATREVVSRHIDPTAPAHLSYGEYTIADFFEHTSYYRAFQAWSIAKFLGIPFAMSDELIDLLWTAAEPQLDMLREYHVFGPPVEVPPDADRETQLLGMTGFLV
jgi:hypothetical protein